MLVFTRVFESVPWILVWCWVFLLTKDGKRVICWLISGDSRKRACMKLNLIYMVQKWSEIWPAARYRFDLNFLSLNKLMNTFGKLSYNFFRSWGYEQYHKGKADDILFWMSCDISLVVCSNRKENEATDKIKYRKYKFCGRVR